MVKERTFESYLEPKFTSISNLTIRSIPWTDSVTSRLKATKESDKSYYVVSKIPNLYDHIYRRLGHIIVSPKDKFNTQALKQAFVYHKDSGAESELVNENPACARALLEQLVEISKDERQNYLNTRNIADQEGMQTATSGSNVIVLHGRRGVGKTFFLNHLYSSFAGELDSCKVLWIRMNLVRDFGNNKDLIYRIYAQTTKIVFRYYDKASFLTHSEKPIWLNLTDDLMGFLESVTDSTLRREMREKLFHMIQVFHGKCADEAISPELVPKPIAERVYRLALESGYSIVLVLDGLDRIDALVHYDRKFRSLLSGFEVLTSQKTPQTAAILLVTRSVTYGEIKEKGSLTNTGRRRLAGDIRLIDIPVLRIIERRIDYLLQEIPMIIRENQLYANWNPDWEKHLLDFKAFVFETDFLSNLDEIYGYNSRAKVQSIQAIYYDFLEKKFEKPYKLTEALMRAGQYFPPTFYTYRLNAKGALERKAGSSLNYDTHFLTSVFRFPCIMDYYQDEGPVYFTYRYHLLAGLRVLQVVNANDQVAAFSTTSFPLLASDIAFILKTLFEYDEAIVTNLIEEFGEFEYVYLSGIGSSVASRPETYAVSKLPKMHHLLDKLIYDVAYLNQCAMRLPLPIPLLEPRNRGFLRAASFELDTLGFWVNTKIRNACSMYRLIRELNTEDYNLYLRNIEKLESELFIRIIKEAFDKGMFTFIDRLKENIIDQLDAIFRGLAKSQKERLMGHMTKYIKDFDGS